MVSWCGSRSRWRRRRPGGGSGGPAARGRRRRWGRTPGRRPGRRGRGRRRAWPARPRRRRGRRCRPSPVQRVGHIHPAAVAADLDHLGAAAQRLVGCGRVRLAADDAAEADRAGLARVEDVADVVLLELAGAPARHVQPAVVHRQVDVADQRGHRPEGLEGRGQQVGVGRLGRDGDDLAGRPAVPVAVPEEDRPRQVLDADDHPDEPPGLGRVVGGRTSSTIWWASPRSMRWVSLRSDMLQKLRWWPNLRPSRSSGSRPFSIIDGVAHSEVMTVS